MLTQSKPNEIAEGHFRFLKPVFSRRGYIIVGAVVGAGEGLTYTKRCEHQGEVRKTVDALRKQIHHDHTNLIEDIPASLINMPKSHVGGVR